MMLNIEQHCSLGKPINAKIDHKAIVFLGKWLCKPFQCWFYSCLRCVKEDCAIDDKSGFSNNNEFDLSVCC